MKENIGFADRIIRVIVAAIIISLYVKGTLDGALGIILLIPAGVIGITGLAGVCPLYTFFGINSSVKKTE